MHFPKALQKGETAHLTFHYSGYASPMLPCNDYQLNLYPNTAWLPRVGLALVEDYVNNGINFAGVELVPLLAASNDYGPVEYTVRIENCKYDMVFCNLPQIDEHTWQGTTEYGLTMAAHGLMRKVRIDDTDVYYPATGEACAETVARKTLSSYSLMQALLPGSEKGSAPKQLLFTPVRNTLSMQTDIITPLEKDSICAPFPTFNDMQFILTSPMYSEKPFTSTAYYSITNSNAFFLAHNRDTLNRLVLAFYFDYQIERGNVPKTEESFVEDELDSYTFLAEHGDHSEEVNRAEELYRLVDKWFASKPNADVVESVFPTGTGTVLWVRNRSIASCRP